MSRRVEPYFAERVGPLTLAITSRIGGVSKPPFDSANLSLNVGDDLAAVVRNRAAAAESVGVAEGRLLFLRQVHGTRVLDATEVGAALVGGDVSVPADAAVVSEAGTAVAVLAADCLPVLFADPLTGLGGAAHVGRRGLALGMIAAVTDRLEALGCRAPVAVLGPAIGACCYEVDSALRDEVGDLADGAAATTTWGTPSLDIRRAVGRQLDRLGIAIVHDVDVCTVESPELYSYRREGVTGRFAGVVARR